MVTIPDAEIDAIPSVETPTTFSVVLTSAADTPEIPVSAESPGMMLRSEYQ